MDIKKGQHVIYSLNTTVFQEITGYVFDLTQSMTQRGKNDYNA